MTVFVQITKSRLTRLFFVSFYFFAVLITHNIMIAFTIEMFVSQLGSRQKEMATREAEKKSLEMLEPNLSTEPEKPNEKDTKEPDALDKPLLPKRPQVL